MVNSNKRACGSGTKLGKYHSDKSWAGARVCKSLGYTLIGNDLHKTSEGKLLESGELVFYTRPQRLPASP